ncbi:hypothetical protein, partial [Halorubrum sp. GN11GM_10-3_MGM]|uniref:hypothetical protein n=1 Tax=Halorubrum sp. GN11GM_10-3_MGM TaxID=2518111 RepID=UPI001A7E1398
AVGAGLKGAAGRAKHGAVSTAGTSVASDEKRNKPRESSRLGLWWCSRSIHRRVRIAERLGLW